MYSVHLARKLMACRRDCCCCLSSEALLGWMQSSGVALILGAAENGEEEQSRWSRVRFYDLNVSLPVQMLTLLSTADLCHHFSL